MTNSTLAGLFDIATPMDILINLFNIVQNLTGGLFVYIFVFLPFIANWLITKSVLLPAVLYLTIGSGLFFLLPVELQGIAKIMVIFGGTGILYTWFKEKY